MKDILKLKLEIAYKVLLYIDNKNPTSKKEINQLLNEAGNYYHITVKRTYKADTMEALIEFLANNKSISETISKLSSSL
jgi:hypothetical protein